MFKKIFIVLFIILLTLIVLISCHQNRTKITTNEIPQNNNGKIGISTMYSSPYFNRITYAIKDVMQPKGYEIIEKVGNFDSNQQAKDIMYFIEEGVKGIFIEPYDYNIIKPALIAAKEANIPVICLDSGCIDNELFVSNITMDNYEIGSFIANDIIKKLNGTGKIIFLENAITNAGQIRAKGFVDTIQANAKNIEFIARENYGGKEEIAQEKMKEILKKTKDFDAVFVDNYLGLIAVIRELQDENIIKDKLLYTVGGSTLELALIRSGILTGTSLLRPYDIGSIGANYMLDYLSGNQNIPKCVNIPTFFIDSTNVELYETDF